MIRPSAAVAAPCPVWCERPHRPADVAPVHVATVLETGDEVVTLIQRTLATGTPGEAGAWIYKPSDSAWTLRASEARIAGQIFTTRTGIAALNRVGNALLAIADLFEVCPAWCCETHHPDRPMVHRHQIAAQELPAGGFRTVSVQSTGSEPVVVLAAADERGTAGIGIPPHIAARMAALGRFHGGDRWLSDALKGAAELLGHDTDFPAF